VQVRLWADPKNAVAGKIREISPVADPSTRTYTAKVSIPAVAEVRLGMTAVVNCASKSAGAADQGAADRAVLEQGPRRSGWWRAAPSSWCRCTIAGAAGNDVLGLGVKAGQTVVTAGVNLLKPGQKVKILGDDLPAAPAPAPAIAGTAK
jgi:multidrug efflux system membrane fusion protein